MSLAIVVTARGCPRNMAELCRAAARADYATVIYAAEDDVAEGVDEARRIASAADARLIVAQPKDWPELPIHGHCPQVRVAGIARAIVNGFDLIWLVDDDGFGAEAAIGDARLPREGDPVRLRRGTTGVLDQYGPVGFALLVRARGTPQVGWTRAIVEEDWRPDGSITRPAPASVVAVQGWCAGDPDVDAAARFGIVPKADAAWLGAERKIPCVLSARTWTPLNAQNTVLTRDAARAYWYPYIEPQGPLGASRMDDILAGWLLQAVLEVRGEHVAIGGPTLVQDRNPHDLYDDLEQEAYGYALSEYVFGWCRQWAQGVAGEPGARERSHAELLGRLAEDLASQAWLTRRPHIVRWVEELGRDAGVWARWGAGR